MIVQWFIIGIYTRTRSNSPTKDGWAPRYCGRYFAKRAERNDGTGFKCDREV